MSSSSEETVVKKRASRKKASAPSVNAKKTATKKKSTTIPAKKTIKRQPKKNNKNQEVVVNASESLEIESASLTISESGTKSRKAPTTLPQATDQKKHTIIATLVVLISFSLMGSGVWIGTSDPGVIDVESLVRQHNERIASGEIEGRPVSTITIPVQRPILRPANVPSAPPVEDVATSTVATSSIMSADEEEGEANDILEGDVMTENSAIDTDDSLPTVGEEDTSYNGVWHLAQRHPFGLI